MSNFKHILFILVLFLLSHSVEGQNSNAQARFETVFGQKNSAALTMLVDSFELALQEKYATNFEEAFLAYLSEVLAGKRPEVWRNEQKNKLVRKYLEDSEVWNEIWLKADSSWMEGNDCCCRYRYKDFTTETRLISDGDIDSFCGILPNKYGSYFDALKAASEYEENVRDYLEVVEIAGVISPTLLASGLSLENKEYYRNYFGKRFLLLDIYLRGYRSE
ncbi:hypothetical protein [uncultured Draconibacterium sp.]|uniref:hypothetical protein n=1 Tax=uncultured Draconibacterium sp. TaxID=1573823 RepID=UPI0025D858D1|nr:hypothetical protein [uncultured Draconibacterium sp.]